MFFINKNELDLKSRIIEIIKEITGTKINIISFNYNYMCIEINTKNSPDHDYVIYVDEYGKINYIYKLMDKFTSEYTTFHATRELMQFKKFSEANEIFAVIDNKLHINNKQAKIITYRDNSMYESRDNDNIPFYNTYHSDFDKVTDMLFLPKYDRQNLRACIINTYIHGYNISLAYIDQENSIVYQYHYYDFDFPEPCAAVVNSNGECEIIYRINGYITIYTADNCTIDSNEFQSFYEKDTIDSSEYFPLLFDSIQWAITNNYTDGGVNYICNLINKYKKESVHNRIKLMEEIISCPVSKLIFDMENMED